MMIRFLLIIGAVLFSQASFARSSDSHSTKSVKGQIDKLREEISQLHLSVKSLSSYQGRMQSELRNHEERFSKRFRAVVIPLLSWPSVSSTTQVKSWIELQHMQMILHGLRQRLVQGPLELIADRELRLSNAMDLKSELKGSLESLEQKESFLALELEELKMLEKKARKSSKKGR